MRGGRRGWWCPPTNTYQVRIFYWSSGVLMIVCERLGSVLVTEHSMMKSSICYLNVDPAPLRPPCVHLTSFMWWVFPVFAALLLLCIILNQVLNRKLWEWPGDNARKYPCLLWNNDGQLMGSTPFRDLTAQGYNNSNAARALLRARSRNQTLTVIYIY